MAALTSHPPLQRHVKYAATPVAAPSSPHPWLWKKNQAVPAKGHRLISQFRFLSKT